MTLADIMLACKLIASKGEARRLVQQGGVLVNGEKASDAYQLISLDALKEGIKIRKGKKVFHRVILK